MKPNRMVAFVCVCECAHAQENGLGYSIKKE